MPTAHHFAGEFSLSSIELALVLLFISFLYVRGWLRLSGFSSNGLQRWRVVSFLLGICLIWTALYSPLAAYDHELLTIHMIQHLLLMTFAPALILLGDPVLVLWHGLPRLKRNALFPPLESPSQRGFARIFFSLELCWIVSAATLVAWHIPVLFTAALHSTVLHGVEQVSFFVAGLLFWIPVVRPWPDASTSPRWSVLLYLFLATLPCDVLSGFLVFSDRVAYSAYFSASRPFGLSVLADQQCAGALMWTVVTITYLVPAAIITTQLLSPQTQRGFKSAQEDSSSMPALKSDSHSLDVVCATRQNRSQSV